jgi:hypothetical protein
MLFSLFNSILMLTLNNHASSTSPYVLPFVAKMICVGNLQWEKLPHVDGGYLEKSDAASLATASTDFLAAQFYTMLTGLSSCRSLIVSVSFRTYEQTENGMRNTSRGRVTTQDPQCQFLYCNTRFFLFLLRMPNLRIVLP